MHLKRNKVALKKNTQSYSFLHIFSIHSSSIVDMKNIVECYKDFFVYFNALETYIEMY